MRSKFVPIISLYLLIVLDMRVAEQSNAIDNNIFPVSGNNAFYPAEDILKNHSRTRYLNMTEYPGELCNRRCLLHSQKVCYFKFVLEHYQAVGVACGRCAEGVSEDCNNDQCIVGDGVEKGVMSINRMIPGPAIQVCKGDMIIVDVVNNAHGTAASLHWHGQHMRGTPFMDGVPFITQCPIPFASTFRYRFWATEAGTHFYHSHSGLHKVNGQYGALIVREPDDDALHFKYDYDLSKNYILISDWMHNYGEQYFPGLPTSKGIYPSSLLINGRGTYINPKTFEHTKVAITKYFVKPGKRYRFRVINSVSHSCAVQLQVQGHSLSIIASDSYNVNPRSFDTLVSNSGERYDFILTANYTQGDFWIRVVGLGVCATDPLESFALLRYETNEITYDTEEAQPAFPEYNQTYALGSVLNHPNATCFHSSRYHCITELTALEEDNELLTTEPDYKLFLAFHNFPVPNKEIFRPGEFHHFANLQSNLTIVGAINNLSMVFPSSPPLTQPFDVDESLYCDELHWPQHCRGNILCPCIHRLKILKDSIVELIIVDESTEVGRMHHPFHLHGYRFMVTALGQHPLGNSMTVRQAMQMEEQHLLPRNYNNNRPPFKDTVSIPSCGFAVIRFRANNPGYWLMHCHYEWHLSIGMGLVVQVGQQSQMMSVPVDFPKCKSYVPQIEVPSSE